MDVKDSRSVNQPEKSRLEQVRDEMERIIVDGRYSKDETTRALIAKISDWRSELGLV